MLTAEGEEGVEEAVGAVEEAEEGDGAADHRQAGHHLLHGGHQGASQVTRSSNGVQVQLDFPTPK